MLICVQFSCSLMIIGDTVCQFDSLVAVSRVYKDSVSNVIFWLTVYVHSRCLFRIYFFFLVCHNRLHVHCVVRLEAEICQQTLLSQLLS